MAEKIYRIELWKGLKEPAYHLSQEEHDEMGAWMQKKREDFGCKVIIRCWTRWSSEYIGIIGIEEFTDVDSLHQYVQALERKGWFHYHDAVFYLGTSVPKDVLAPKGIPYKYKDALTQAEGA